MISSNDGSCNIIAYSEWHSSRLEDTENLPITLNQLRLDLLRVDRAQKEIWQTMDFDHSHDDFIKNYGGRRPKQLNITNGQAMEVSSVYCKDELISLRESSAGGHGPPSTNFRADSHGEFLLTLHESMCLDYCLASDALREEAIATSTCNCLELSTEEDDISYTREGDFCLKNSGYLLCDQIDRMDVCSSCELEDFMCGRREYDAIEVPLKGYGNECNGCEIFRHGALLLCIAFLATATFVL